MSAPLLRSLLVVSLWLLGTGSAHAEGGCAPGMYPFQFAPNQPTSCAPIPGAGNQQAPQQPAPQWESRWGAIVTSTQDGILGVATDKRSKREASQAAMQDCQSKGGLNCKIDAAYDNQCAAVVVGNGGYNVQNASTTDRAVAIGMKTCRDGGHANCHIYYSACSLPVRTR
jgi:hypothetical protein